MLRRATGGAPSTRRTRQLLPQSPLVYWSFVWEKCFHLAGSSNRQSAGCLPPSNRSLRQSPPWLASGESPSRLVCRLRPVRPFSNASLNLFRNLFGIASKEDTLLPEQVPTSGSVRT